MNIFTLTGGRTGTAWLANLIRENTGEPCLHEALDVNGFCTHTPCTKTLRWFNTHGYGGPVEQFWAEKMAVVAESPNWFETSHLLGKAGLCEHLTRFKALRDETKIIVLRRNLVKQCASYIFRGDFSHVANIWQFFLDRTYTNNLVSFDEVQRVASDFAYPIWYALEIEARQQFYVKRYGGDLTFISVRLEDLINENGAINLLSQLGLAGRPVLPDAANQGATVGNELRQEVERTIEKCLQLLDIDPH